MKKIVSLFLFMSLACQSQKIDSLKVLTKNDWRTLYWFERDTVHLYKREKTKTNFVGLNERQILKRKKKDLYGERISFKENGDIIYTNHLFCPVGESLKKIYRIDFKKGKLIVDFETKKWPWKENKAKREKKEFIILEWDIKRIVLKTNHK